MRSMILGRFIDKASAPLGDLYSEDPGRACRVALHLTRFEREHERLGLINQLLGMFGVEAIRGEWQNGYWCDIRAVYCNAGETYALTVIHARGDWSGAPGEFIVASFGDYIEELERNGEELP